jgi:membrane protease YdiL (CAAX protease family)
MQGMWDHLGGFGKLLVFTILVFVSFMVFSLLALLAAIPFTENFSLLSGQNLPMSIDFLRYFQIVQSFSVFIIPSLLAGFLFYGHLTKGLKLTTPHWGLVGISLLIIITAQPLVSYLGVWNSTMQLPDFLGGLEQWMASSEASAGDIIYRFLDTDQPVLLLLNVLMIAILPALGEEMLFRGVLQPVFAEWLRNKHAAVLITAFLFSAIHLQFFTFMPRFFLGLALGYLFLWGKNLWYPIAGHFANNFLSLIIFYYYRQTQPDINPLEPNADELSFVWIIPSTLIMTLLIIKFVRDTRKEYKI